MSSISYATSTSFGYQRVFLNQNTKPGHFLNFRFAGSHIPPKPNTILPFDTIWLDVAHGKGRAANLLIVVSVTNIDYHQHFVVTHREVLTCWPFSLMFED